MEFFLELLVDLIFEGTLAISASRKISPWIRYPLIVLVGLFFAAVIGIVLLTGVLMLREIWFVGLLFIALALWFAFWTVRKFRRVYIERREKWD